MRVTDLFETDDIGYHSEQEDNSPKKMGELRKSRLTIMQIRRLRQMNDIRKFEEEKKIQALSKQYKPVDQSGAMPAV